MRGRGGKLVFSVSGHRLRKLGQSRIIPAESGVVANDPFNEGLAVSIRTAAKQCLKY